MKLYFIQYKQRRKLDFIFPLCTLKYNWQRIEVAATNSDSSLYIQHKSSMILGNYNNTASYISLIIRIALLGSKVVSILHTLCTYNKTH